jgi:hypothetical protein
MKPLYTINIHQKNRTLGLEIHLWALWNMSLSHSPTLMLAEQIKNVELASFCYHPLPLPQRTRRSDKRTFFEAEISGLRQGQAIKLEASTTRAPCIS